MDHERRKALQQSLSFCFFGACFFSPVALTACDGGRSKPYAKSASSLGQHALKGHWSVLKLEDRPLIDDTEISIHFTASGLIRGNAGANDFQAQSQTNHNGLFKTSDIVVTERYAITPPGLMEQEGRFLRLLRRANRWHQTEETMSLFLDERVLLLLQKQENG